MTYVIVPIKRVTRTTTLRTATLTTLPNTVMNESFSYLCRDVDIIVDDEVTQKGCKSANSHSGDASIVRTRAQEQWDHGPDVRDGNPERCAHAEYADAVIENKGMSMVNQGEMTEFTHTPEYGKEGLMTKIDPTFDMEMPNWATKDDLFNETMVNSRTC